MNVTTDTFERDVIERSRELPVVVRDVDATYRLVGDPGAGQEARVRLGRIGFDRVVGSLDDPLTAVSPWAAAASSTRPHRTSAQRRRSVHES